MNKEEYSPADFVSPSYNPSNSSTIEEEAMLHIIKEDYGGYADRAKSYFTNSSISGRFEVLKQREASGKINCAGGATLGSISFPEGYENLYDEPTYWVYATMALSLWLYRVS